MTPAPFLIISSDVIDRRMAGQGIRCLELARALSQHIPVRLAVPLKSDISVQGVEVVIYHYGDPASLEKAWQGASAVFVEPFILDAHPALSQSNLPIVVDLYNPFVLEHLSIHRERPLAEQEAKFYENTALCNAVCARGDFFTCATERQRDWWLGVLQANGRINPYTMTDDPTLCRLIDVVAYGVPEMLAAYGDGKASIPFLSPQDKVILWGGGLWNWLDPLTLIRAMPAVVAEEPNAKLLFPGTRHPNTAIVPDMEMRRHAENLADELGLRDTHIIFGEWVPYDRWGHYLTAADVAVSFHTETPETRFAALRSRVLGYLGARVPMVVQAGDRASEIVAEYELGEVVPSHDPAAASAALVKVLRTGKAAYRDHFTPVLAQLSWAEVAAPLLAFARAPHRAPDISLRRGMVTAPATADTAEVTRLRAEIKGYENGRVMRLLNTIQRVRTTATPSKSTMLPKTRDPLYNVRRATQLALTLNPLTIKRELENYAAWKVPPIRRAAERQWRKMTRRRTITAGATRLHRIYQFRLQDLGDQHPAFRGIYTPGYRDDTVDNYLQAQFTDNAETYATKYTNYDYFRKELSAALERVNFPFESNATILDIGSGAGNSILPLCDLCPNAYIIASDLSVQLLKLLQQVLPSTPYADRVELLQLNAEELDFAPKSLDLVVGVAVLHHLFEPERTLEGSAKVLKSGGHAIFLEPFAEGCLTVARLYRTILADSRAADLHEKLRWMLDAIARDFEVRSEPDKTLPVFNQLDDKQLFTVDFFREHARRYGFRDCTIMPLRTSKRQYEGQTNTYLKLLGLKDTVTMPEWAWNLIRAEDTTPSADLPIEACVVLTK